jgi:FAD/FMN-containing dehydrogenase
VLYADLVALGGSFSAEHGVGSKRIHSLLATADETKLKLMRRVKDTLDGHSLMNPGKVLPLASHPINDSSRNGVEAHA